MTNETLPNVTIEETSKSDSFWLGFTLGFIVHVFGYVIAIFLKQKKMRKGLLIGSTISFVITLIAGFLLAIMFILIYRGRGPL